MQNDHTRHGGVAGRPVEHPVPTISSRSLLDLPLLLRYTPSRSLAVFG